MINLKKTNWKKIILIIISLIIFICLLCLFFYTNVIKTAWNFSNNNSGAIQALSTIILTIITLFYAIFTFKMVEIANKQITADINISNKILESRFKNFNIKSLDIHSVYDFRFDFDVFNKSSGAGTIEKPILILKIDDKKWLVNPVREEYTGSESHSTGNLIDTHNFYKDLGGTIYLKGGGFEKVKLEYRFNPDSDFVDSFQENQNIEYLIEYKNNLGDKKLVKINNDNIIPNI